MKKCLILLICISLILLSVSCGARTAFDIAEAKLDESVMSKEKCTQEEIDELESRFEKMDLEGGFKRVLLYRSETSFAYIIEFENASDAKLFGDTLSTSLYDISYSENVAVYGDSGWIKEIEFK